MEKRRFRGSMVALVTPFQADGNLDWDAMARLIAMHIQEGTHALIVCGTTGETPTLTAEERRALLTFSIKEAAGRIPVIAGTGTNNTVEAVSMSREAEDLGADGLLVVTPAYNKPTQEGMLHYYNAILSATSLPVVLYNVPGRTAANLLPETVAKLAEHPHVVGIKDATGNMMVASDIVEQCGDRLDLLSGDDFTALALMALGGKGWISVTANVVPAQMVEMYDAFVAGDLAKARKLHYTLQPLNRAMFLQSNPIPVKAALALMGHCENTLRSPLMPMQGAALEGLRDILRKQGLVD